MTKFTEAHPIGYPNLTVRIHEGPNASAEEHSAAFAAADNEIAVRFRQEYPTERLGAAIVYACHENDSPNNLPRAL